MSGWQWKPDPRWLAPGEASYGWQGARLRALIERSGGLWRAYDGHGLVTVALDGTEARAVVEHTVDLAQARR